MAEYSPLEFLPRTERLQRSLDQADQTSVSLIEPHNILLGMITEGKGLAAKVLDNLGVNAGSFRLGISDIVEPSTGHIGSNFSLSPASHRVFHIADNVAKSLGHHWVGTEHTLLGIMYEGQADIPELRSPTVAVLEDEFGATLAKIRQETQRILELTPEPPKPTVINRDVIMVLHGWNLLLQNPNLNQEKRARYVERLLSQLEQAGRELGGS